MKGFAVATVELGDGAEVDVYTLHAEAGGDPEDDVLRQTQFDQLAAHIAERSAGRAVIVAGHTNLHLEPDHEDEPIDRPVWEDFLAETGLTDVCAEVDVFVGPAGEPLSNHPAVAVEWLWTAAA